MLLNEQTAYAHLCCPDAPLAIIGLGYVGLPLTVEFGKHRPVVGFDIKPERIAELQAGQDSTRETTSATTTTV
jgi:UDP-N-acetyl-D-galactosamine dehydrogenase